MQNISIVGMGLIGGSLGMALRKKNPQLRVCGVDISENTVEEALRRGIVDWGTVNLREGVSQADLVILATPLFVMGEVCKEMAPFLKEGTVVTDVGSTKAKTVKLLEKTLPPSVYIIGGHPMAGSEKWGLYGANELLFENAAYILTPTPTTPLWVVERLTGVIDSIGAKVIILSPEEHDRKVAAVSHLPHIMASALVNTVGPLEKGEGGYFALAAGGFRDTTRIAGGQSTMWCDILLRNREPLIPLVEDLIKTLDHFRNTLVNNDEGGLYELLNRGRQWRESIPTGLKGILPQLFDLTVTVPDRPGVIVELTSLLADRKINISDIEIQRVREADEGTIRLGFIEEKWRDEALSILVKSGFQGKVSGV